MADRSAFDTKHDGFDIIKHSDGSLTIEASADYGDSEIGWGSASATMHLSAERVRELARFLSD